MEILVLGGTGAMGKPLVRMLSAEGHKIYVTTRSSQQSENNIEYVQGNAKDDSFLRELLSREYDVIVDFMIYSTDEFKKRMSILLDHTEHYFFFSSSRVYANSEQPITEDSYRLLDVCKDDDYLQTDEYALMKARSENLLWNSGRKNWTIIRPYITYNSNRLQLGVYEKEEWLKRALAGKTIVLPKDIASKKTSLTYGPDVATAIVKLIKNERAFGEAFHIVNEQSATWEEILNFYLKIIEKKTGEKPKVKLIENSCVLQSIWNPWQIKYDRLYDRTFNSDKIAAIGGLCEYRDMYEGLESCLTEFLDNINWKGTQWKYEAYCDKMAGDHTKLTEIPGKKMKLKYIKWRYLDKW